MKTRGNLMTVKKIAAAAALLAAVCLLAAMAGAQADMVKIEGAAFGAPERPAAVFKHDDHNEKAKLDDCAVCHHSADEKGRLVPREDSAGTPCADCHALEGGKTIPLMRAYHRQCQGCHDKVGKGPTGCGECHVRDK
ncbi:MAG: acidic tetraheme cytochrome c3 TmcA [Thermodesulfobacteriota bacterium]